MKPIQASPTSLSLPLPSVRSLPDPFMNLPPSLAPVLRAGDARMLSGTLGHFTPFFCLVHPLLINAANIVMNSFGAFRLALVARACASSAWRIPNGGRVQHPTGRSHCAAIPSAHCCRENSEKAREIGAVFSPRNTRMVVSMLSPRVPVPCVCAFALLPFPSTTRNTNAPH